MIFIARTELCGLWFVNEYESKGGNKFHFGFVLMTFSAVCKDKSKNLID